MRGPRTSCAVGDQHCWPEAEPSSPAPSSGVFLRHCDSGVQRPPGVRALARALRLLHMRRLPVDLLVNANEK